MTRKAITPSNAVAVGPYSAAIDAGALVFLSGQTPIDPSTGKLVQGDAAAQTKRCLANLRAALHAAGLTLDDVVKVNVFLTDMNDFAAMNAAYREAFAEPFPARTTIGVAALPLGARVEIELIAKKPT
jgi:2-iminobutanoate/2-iminopropanoate deaminase